MRIAVVGGGIQGSCIAMELALRGIEVDLIEARHRIMEGASRHTEGKIHLGFVYANDPGLLTADLMIAGAHVFAPHMRRWLGTAFKDIPVSSPFAYVVHEKSLVDAEDLERSYAKIANRIARGIDGDYFGRPKPDRMERLSDYELVARYGPQATAAFATDEIAIDPEPLADLISSKIATIRAISVKPEVRVNSIDSSNRTLRVTDSGGDRFRLGPYDHVVNCAWESRLALDASVGMFPPEPWSFRMKYFLRATGGPKGKWMPTTTIVLGPFGDLVDYGQGDYYLSWYPVGRRGWSSAIEPPAWPTRLSASEARAMASRTVESLAGVLGTEILRFDLENPDVRGGFIYALGNSDVDDPESRLHQRSGVGPVTAEGWYHSVDTGKLTTAPMFAMQTVDRIAPA